MPLTLAFMPIELVGPGPALIAVPVAKHSFTCSIHHLGHDYGKCGFLTRAWPCRRTSDDSLVVAVRGPLQFVGEVSTVAAPNMPHETWRTSIRAATDVAALLLTRECLRMLVSRVPETEVAMRACEAPVIQPRLAPRLASVEDG